MGLFKKNKKQLIIFMGHYKQRSQLFETTTDVHPSVTKALVDKAPQFVNFSKNTTVIPPQHWFDEIIDEKMANNRNIDMRIQTAILKYLTERFGRDALGEKFLKTIETSMAPMLYEDYSTIVFYVPCDL